MGNGGVAGSAVSSMNRPTSRPFMIGTAGPASFGNLNLSAEPQQASDEMVKIAAQTYCLLRAE